MLHIRVGLSRTFLLLTLSYFASSQQQSAHRRLLQELERVQVDPICGRQDTIEGDPLVASIQLQNPVASASWHLCGGIQISEAIILTTASCIVDLRPTGNSQPSSNGTLIPNIYVALSPYCRHQRGRSYAPVLYYYMHPEFVRENPQTNTLMQNDIALLELDLSDQTGSLPDDFDPGRILVNLEFDLDPNMNRTFSLVSYGQKNENESVSMFNDAYYRNMLSHDLDQVRFLDEEACRQILGEGDGDGEAQHMFLCGEMVDGNLCPGDYGAPVSISTDIEGVQTDTLLGLYSWTPQRTCKGVNQSVIFTNVPYYVAWILDMVQYLQPGIEVDTAADGI